MTTRSFGSLFMVASCAGAALGCYLVSLHVASERAKLEDVEGKIVLAQRDMRLLQTEIGTRGRLSQLERWNAGAFSMNAPSATQFVQSSFELAKLTQPQHEPEFQAPVLMASAPAPEQKQAPIGEAVADDGGARQGVAPNQLIHQASLTTGIREVPAKTMATLPRSVVTKAADKPVSAARSAPPRPVAKLVTSAAKPGLAAAHFLGAKPAAKKMVDKQASAASKPMTKPVRVAKADPLAPLAGKQMGKPKDHTTGR
jgi:hypothetical protein